MSQQHHHSDHAEAHRAHTGDEYTIPTELPPILKDLSREVLRHQPQDIVQFCADYFAKLLSVQRTTLMDKVDPQTKASLATPPQDLGNAVARAHVASNAALSAAAGAPGAGQGTSSPAPVYSYTTNTDDSDMSDDDEDDDDEVADDDVPIPAPVLNRGRRTSVSAESMAPTAAHDVVEKVVVHKTPEQRARIGKAIGNNFLFRNLDEEQYEDVVNAMTEKRVAAGEVVIKQGGVGDYFYVVEDGALDVFVNRNNQGDVKVTDYSSGGSFGELALMYNAPRAATVKATADSVLWALDRVTFRRILMDHTSRKRRMYEGFLEQVPLLLELEPYERHKIADALESVTFEDGETVIKQGDPGDAFYIIEAGEADVIKVDDKGVEHPLKPLVKGNYFGELALLSDKPRAVTIKAKGKLKCATMGKKAFTRLLGPLATIMQRNTQNYEGYAGN